MNERGLRWKVFRVAFGLVGLTFLAVAFWKTWDVARPPVLPDWTTALTAFIAVVAGLVAAALAWAALFEGAGSTRRLAHGLYVAQFGKHIPGGIWQAIGVIGLAVGPGVSAARAATAFPVQVVVQIVAGLTVGALLGVAGTDAAGWVRILALCGLASLPLLRRPWMAAAAARIRKWRKIEGPDHLPPQAAILRCYGWTTATFVLSGCAFTLLLGAPVGAEMVAAVGVFGFAWVAGFVALPFPSGIGIREAVMVAAFGSVAAPVIAASLLHRVVTMAAEAALAVVTWRPR